jgi:ubiquinone/menaquinone biosynthesis C-methylase UbiE
MGDRVPLTEEPIAGMDAILQYDKGARLYMMPEYKYFVRKILKRGIRSGRVLDIGTGSGLLAIELARATNCHFDIVALDISRNMISKARENAGRSGVADKITFMVATAAALPFPDKSFDLVISYASLHHWFEPVAVFNEIARVTKETGCAIIRDNKRVYQNLAWRAIIWLISRFMNRRHRENWPRAILASYTIPEVNGILSRSNLHNYRVSSDFVFIDLCIESPVIRLRNGSKS